MKNILIIIAILITSFSYSQQDSIVYVVVQKVPPHVLCFTKSKLVFQMRIDTMTNLTDAYNIAKFYNYDLPKYRNDTTKTIISGNYNNIKNKINYVYNDNTGGNINISKMLEKDQESFFLAKETIYKYIK